VRHRRQHGRIPSTLTSVLFEARALSRASGTSSPSQEKLLHEARASNPQPKDCGAMTRFTKHPMTSLCSCRVPSYPISSPVAFGRKFAKIPASSRRRSVEKQCSERHRAGTGVPCRPSPESCSPAQSTQKIQNPIDSATPQDATLLRARGSACSSSISQDWRQAASPGSRDQKSRNCKNSRVGVAGALFCFRRSPDRRLLTGQPGASHFEPLISPAPLPTAPFPVSIEKGKGGPGLK